MHVGDSRITLFVILLIRGGGIGPTPRRRGYAEGGTDRGTRQALRRAGPDRAPAIGDRQVQARDVRAALRAQSASDRSTGIAARGARRGCGGGREGGEGAGGELHAAPGDAAQLSRRSAA